jgi:hypothetical protein
MCTKVLQVIRLTVVAGLIAGLTGCATSEKQISVASASSKSCAQRGNEESDKQAEKEKRAEDQAKDERQHAKLERGLEIAHRGVEKARMAQAHSEVEQAVALAKAERELNLETQRLHIFMERTAPERIEQAKLGLVRAEDRVKENEEELRQLEMMYAEEDFADQTKEIVLERGRRRLQRSQRDLELRRESLATLTERTIPLETAEHESKVENKARDLEKARRTAEACQLAKHIDLMKAEAEVARLEAEIAALDEKMEKRRKEGEK